MKSFIRKMALAMAMALTLTVMPVSATDVDAADYIVDEMASDAENDRVAAPVFTPENGKAFSGSLKITISCETEGARIYYTTDNTDPTTDSTLYEGEFTITKSTVIKAFAVADGADDSEIVTAIYRSQGSVTGGGGGGGGVSVGGGGSGSGGGGYSEPKQPQIGDAVKGWKAIADYLLKQAAGSEVTIKLNGYNVVPGYVIKAIALNDIKTTFVFDHFRSWYADGADIADPLADEQWADTDLTISIVHDLDASLLPGKVGSKMHINGVNIPAVLNIDYKAANGGKFANFYKKDGEALVLAETHKLSDKGKVTLKDATAEGDYVVMVCDYSVILGDVNNDGYINELDAIAMLNDIVLIEQVENPDMMDFTEDDIENAYDASSLLAAIISDSV